jgi:hypothetical protein
MSYDSKCYELAETFLLDANCMTKERAGELAQEIQDVIESYLNALEDSKSGI